MCYTVSSIDDVRELVTTVRHVSTFMDPSKLCAAACGALHSLLGTDVAAISLVKGGRPCPMECVWGAGEEFGELVAASQLPQDHSLASDGQPVRLCVLAPTSSSALAAGNEESIRWLLAQPVIFGGETIAVLYAGQRGDRDFDDRVVSLIREFSASIAPIMAMSIRAERAGERARREERLRIAQNLHDTAGQILFSIGLNASKVQAAAELGEDREVTILTAKDIAIQAAEASECLRAAFLSLVDDSYTLPVTMREYSRLFSRRTGIHVEFVEIGEPFATPTEVDHALYAVVREGLHNIEKHADASSVFVTLTYGRQDVALVIQDDGVGMAEGEVSALAGSSQHFGLPSLLQRVDAVGGDLELGVSEDGGVNLRVNIPTAGYLHESSEDSGS